MFKPLPLLVYLICLAYAQDSDCDFDQSVKLNRTYNINSPQYPSNYTAGVQCRWIAECPAGYNCRLDCDDIALPQSDSCSVDRLLISKTGDSQLADADKYCGRRSVSVVSTGQRISLRLITSYSSPGGRFLCQLSAQ